MYYDAHTHLNEDRLYADRQAHLDRFVEAEGKGLINIGVDQERNHRAIDIAQQAADLYGTRCLVKAAIGIHPGEVSFGKISSHQQIEQKREHLRSIYLQHNKHIVALGECGIDAHYEGYAESKALQQALFHAHCQLAAELDLPVIIHTRDQFDDTWEVVKHYPQLRFYFHCRGYEPEQVALLARELPEVRVGFCGNVTYPKAASIRASLLEVAKHTHCHLLLETDAPYLTPQAVRGERNNPAFVTYTYAYAAELLGISLEELQKNVQDSFERLYDIKCRV